MTNKPFDLSLILGRMQMFHVGHEHLINTALSVSDRVLVLLGSAQEYGTIKNPFPAITRHNMIKEVFPGHEVIVGAINDIDGTTIDENWANHVLSTVKQYTRKMPDIYIYGHEPKNHNWFKCSPELITRTKQMTEMIVARERHNISATQMREWLFYDEFDKWAAFANPKLHKLFEVYRTELLNAKEIKPLVKQYLERKQESWADKLQVF